jgi:protein CpxP
MKLFVAALTSTLMIGSLYATTAVAISTAADAPSAPIASNVQRDIKVENHIKDLHAKLKITAAEEAQWSAVSKVMHDNADAIDTVIEKRETLLSPTAIEDLNAYSDIAQAHVDAVKKLASAFSPLYASMSDAQKKVADSVFLQNQKKNKHSATAMN